jgi:hypothetical protein
MCVQQDLRRRPDHAAHRQRLSDADPDHPFDQTQLDLRQIS